MTPEKRLEFKKSLSEKYNHTDLFIIQELYQQALNVLLHYYDALIEPEILDEIINRNVVGISDHSYLREGILLGITILCSEVERDFTNTITIVQETFKEKVSNG